MKDQLISLSLMQLIKFLKGSAGGFVGGVIFVFSIHAVNAFIGCASFSWPHTPPSDAMTWLKVYGQMGLVVVQGTVMASAISMVEELLFRSWLPQEIAVDIGYHQGIIISGLAFSILQRSVFFLELCFAYCVSSITLSGPLSAFKFSHSPGNRLVIISYFCFNYSYLSFCPHSFFCLFLFKKMREIERGVRKGKQLQYYVNYVRESRKTNIILSKNCSPPQSLVIEGCSLIYNFLYHLCA